MKKKKIKLNKKAKSFLLIGLVFTSILITGLGASYANVEETVQDNANYLAYAKNGFVYLSDIDYLTASGMSQNGWSGHNIQKDKNQEGGILSLIVDGEKRPYVKGVSIHARGWATYDISELSSEYTRFIAKIGVDAGRGTAGSIIYTIFASNDASNWDTLLRTGVLTGTSEAVDVDVNIEGYKYLRIYVDPNGANTSDHGTIANAKLATEEYESKDVFYDKIHKLEYYDEILKQHDPDYNYEHNYRLILEREVVNKIGYWSIQNKISVDDTYADTMDWLLSSDETLEQLIEVGEVANGTVFLDTLHKLYIPNKEEMKTENGYVYKKMLIALAAAYKTDNVASPLTFSTSPREYDVVERYRLVKWLFDTGKFVRTEEFKGYHVELMRFVMQDAISNEELIWLYEYSMTKKDPFNKYSYISYRYNPNYGQAAYRDPANKEKYDNKYNLSKYNVPYGDNTTRYWMAFEYGGICWNISRIGQTINKIKGIPSVGIYQPDHEAYIIYSQKADGTGIWTQNYNIFGWGKSSTKWWGGNRYRLLLNWSNKPFANQVMSNSNYGTSSGYLLLGQAALNRLSDWKKSLYMNYLANSYESDEDKLTTYNKALDSLDINLDSFDYLINLYKRNNKTSAEWRALAEEIIDVYTYYPNAMYDILKLIKPYLQGMDRVDIDLREQEALKAASKATDADILQSGPTREIANAILGRARQELASFSFDGNNAGKIIINNAYEAYDFNLSYSVDGGKTYSEKTTSHVLELTEEEIKRITAENDIKIRMDGTPQVYTIDITTGAVATNLYANDLENRVVGITVDYEWSNNESGPWTSYKTASPDNSGDKTLYVRMGAHGTRLASSPVSYNFTEDNQPNTRKYVPVSHLSIHSVSTQATSNAGSAIFAIDANYNTRWHSAWNGSDTQRFITIKLDKPRYVSAVEFVPAGGGNGKIIDGIVYGSYDGEEWIELSRMTNLRYTNQANTNEEAIANTKSFEIAEPQEIQYVKIVATRASNGNWFTARHFNIFQDITKNPRPTAGIGYSETEPTKNNVIARLVNVSTNNYDIIDENDNVIPTGGDTHTFTDNGTYTFRFRDRETGVVGTAKAVVDWIDRIAPTATISYSTTSLTNKSVIATLKPSEEITVTNNGTFKLDEQDRVLDAQGNVLDGYTVDDNGYVKNPQGAVIGNINNLIREFTENGEFTFEFEDKAGNKGTATAKVTWIDRITPTATISYDKEALTNQDVTVTVEFDEEVVVTNNGGKHSYTFTENGEFKFEFRDLAGNVNTITAKVDWIDKVAPTAELKYETQGDKVIVRVVNPSKEITFQNGNGTYEYTKNGSYDIVFFDKLGNMGKVTAVITNFKDDENQGGNTDPGENKPDDKPNTDNPGNQGGNSNGSNKPNTGNNQGNTNTKPGNDGNQKPGNTNDDEDSTDEPTDKDDTKPGDKDEENKPNDKDDNDNSTPSKPVDIEEEKKSNAIYIILAAIVAGLGITITAIIAFRKKD